MSVLIKGMEMPQTGCYFISVDNTNGRDKTMITVERMLGNRDVRQIVGSYELIHVPPHGKLIDADVLYDKCVLDNSTTVMATSKRLNEYMQIKIEDAQTVIPADFAEDTNVPIKEEGE